MPKNKPRPVKGAQVSDDHWRKLVDKFSLSTLDDVVAGVADEFTIRHYCTLAAKIIHETFKDAKSQEKKLMMLARDVFMRIGRGSDADEAFFLKTKNRRKNDKSHDIGIALIVWGCVKDGLSTVKAINAVAETTNLSFERVRELYYRHKDEIDSEYQSLLGS